MEINPVSAERKSAEPESTGSTVAQPIVTAGRREVGRYPNIGRKSEEPESQNFDKFGVTASRSRTLS